MESPIDPENAAHRAATEGLRRELKAHDEDQANNAHNLATDDLLSLLRGHDKAEDQAQTRAKTINSIVSLLAMPEENLIAAVSPSGDSKGSLAAVIAGRVEDVVERMVTDDNGQIDYAEAFGLIEDCLLEADRRLHSDEFNPAEHEQSAGILSVILDNLRAEWRA
ncbi:MAG TPA: hypothetical protein VGA08_02715 [Candidatus Saccharimonadales bacterium]